MNKNDDESLRRRAARSIGIHYAEEQVEKVVKRLREAQMERVRLLGKINELVGDLKDAKDWLTYTRSVLPEESTSKSLKAKSTK